MKNKLTRLIIVTTLTIFGILPVMPTYAASGSSDICGTDAPNEVKEAAGCNVGTNLTVVVTNIINAVIGVLGLVAVIFIVIGAVQYITSSGDAGKIKKAKDTILYACIGLIVAALTYAIVNFVIFILNGGPTVGPVTNA